MPLPPLAKFLAVGALNTGVGLGVIYLAKYALDAGDVSANALGYAVGLVLSFALNRSWTFGHTGPVHKAAARFAVVIALAYLLNLATVLFSIHALGVNGYVAQALGIVPYTAFTFIASRYWAFEPARS